jgi:hypothetical protein
MNDLRKPEYYYRRFTIKKISDNYAQRWGVKNTLAIYQNYICQFHYKENVLAEPRKLAAKSQGSAGHSLNTHTLVVYLGSTLATATAVATVVF